MTCAGEPEGWQLVVLKSLIVSGSVRRGCLLECYLKCLTKCLTHESTCIVKARCALVPCWCPSHAVTHWQMMDLGSVHERSTALFTITRSQYAPAAVHGEEDRVMVRGLVLASQPDLVVPCLAAQSAVMRN